MRLFQTLAIRPRIVNALAVVSLTLPGAPGSSSSSSHSPADAQRWVRDAIDASGGEQVLRGIRAVRIHGIDQVSGVGYSPDIDHPRMYYQSFDELRDVASMRVRRHYDASAPSRDDATPVTAILSDSVSARAVATLPLTAGTGADVELAREQLRLGPERLLLTLLDAPDLHATGDTVIQGVPHHVVSIRGGTLRVYLSAVTHLPTLIDVLADYPDDSEWAVWGDVHTRTWFSSWSLEPGAIRYPRTWSIERNGLPVEKVSVVRLDVHAPAPADSFDIPAAVRARFAKAPPTVLGNGLGQPPIELADGVTYVPGRWAVLIVHQPSGVVVVDAPLSTQYSRRVFEEATRRYPTSPVHALVVTDFMWAHAGGLREYVARRVPVFGNARNESLVRRMVAASHRIHPDSLEAARRPLAFRAVSRIQEIGEGPNRIQLIPVDVAGADYGRKIALVYFPERHVLYASDLYSPRGEVNFAPQGASELAEAVSRNGLTVETVVGSHLAPTPWATVLAATRRASPEPRPND